MTYKILLVHNFYQEAGGEDQAYANEGALLEAYGHHVVRYTDDNKRMASENALALATGTVWSSSTYRNIRALIRREDPQVAHFHNTFPLISPSAYAACREEGVPVVQTLHNYRLLCPNALFFRDGGACEDCLGKSVPWPGFVHACYRESRAQSAMVGGMLAIHRGLRTWKNKVDKYVTLTEFARDKFVQGGIPEEKLSVKPNFIDPDPGLGEGRGNYALYVGRLSVEKGADTMLAAWERLRGVPLKIVGDGPLAPKVARAAESLPDVDWLGSQAKEQVMALMKDASVLIFPSICYEGFPMVIAEAYAVGLPVVASNLGSMSSLVEPGRTGLHFHPGDPEDLAAQIQWTLTHPAELEKIRRRTRAEYELKYTAERNYRMLMEIYGEAVDDFHVHAKGSS